MRISHTRSARSRRIDPRRVAFAVGLGCVAASFAVGVGEASDSEFPLDDVPGYGRSEEATARDDAFAYWEAYRREVVVADCMSEAGFDYEPDVQYPSPATIEVAEFLEVPTDGATRSVEPGAENAAYARELDPSVAEDYWQALVGESAETMEHAAWNEPIEVAPGEKFAAGGCVGNAAAEIGSIWERRDEIISIDEFYAEVRATSDYASMQQEYGKCTQELTGLAATSPGDLEAALAAGAAPEGYEEALEACQSTWDGGSQTAAVALAESLQNSLAKELDGQKEGYSDALDSMRSDEEFLRYLERHAANALDETKAS